MVGESAAMSSPFPSTSSRASANTHGRVDASDSGVVYAGTGTPREQVSRSSSTKTRHRGANFLQNCEPAEVARQASIALRALLGDGGRNEICIALQTLEALIDILLSMADSWARRALLEVNVGATRKRASAALQDVEKLIIDTKLALVCALESTDSIAHDLSRAKKKLDGLIQTERESDSMNVGSFEQQSATSNVSTQTRTTLHESGSAAREVSVKGEKLQEQGTTSEEQILERTEAKIRELEELTQSEMVQLRNLDAAIVKATDETADTKMRREFLQKKLTAALDDL